MVGDGIICGIILANQSRESKEMLNEMHQFGINTSFSIYLN